MPWKRRGCLEMERMRNGGDASKVYAPITYHCFPVSSSLKALWKKVMYSLSLIFLAGVPPLMLPQIFDQTKFSMQGSSGKSNCSMLFSSGFASLRILWGLG